MSWNFDMYRYLDENADSCLCINVIMLYVVFKYITGRHEIIMYMTDKYMYIFNDEGISSQYNYFLPGDYFI